MLSRFVYVDKAGSMEIRGNTKAIYSTMVNIRSQIIYQSGFYIKRALIIGVRYSVCRRQFSTLPGMKAERKILDYQAHMVKLGPILADAYVMMATGKEIASLERIMYQEMKNGKFKTLDILHHFTSGLKSIYSQMCYDSIDIIRQNCGGAGYSAHSLLPQMWSDYSPVPTYEGDNTVMAQQSMNYLEKKIKKIQKGLPAKGIFSYLNDIEKLCSMKRTVTTVDEFMNLQHLDDALAVRAAFKVRDVI